MLTVGSTSGASRVHGLLCVNLGTIGALTVTLYTTWAYKGYARMHLGTCSVSASLNGPILVAEVVQMGCILPRDHLVHAAQPV